MQEGLGLMVSQFLGLELLLRQDFFRSGSNIFESIKRTNNGINWANKIPRILPSPEHI